MMLLAERGSLADRMRPPPPAWDAALSVEQRADVFAQASDSQTQNALEALLQRVPVSAVIGACLQGSPYLRSLIVRDSRRLARLLDNDPDAVLKDLITRLHLEMALADGPGSAMALLRRFKQEIALLTALSDLGGVWPVMTVTEALTRAADAAVQSAVRSLFAAAHARGDYAASNPERPEEGSGYVVLGMGKYGAFELNYSSDIDLIVFYDPAHARLRAGIEPADFFVRLTRDLVRLISERTKDGYVFRTDLRLRPDAGATQIALSREAAEQYYETVGQNWERAALIKARVVAGDGATGAEMLADLGPFIWRKYLDFAAIADVHAMKRQIHASKGFSGIAVAGHDVKLGPGGIREIEFFVQTQQLIAGGRQPSLRTASTRDALERLLEAGWISGQVARDLDSAYLFLRTIEHRLQMVADEQTHRIPAERGALERFVTFAGFDDGAAFSAAVLNVLRTVQGHYARLFEKSAELTSGTSNLVFAGEADDPATLAALAKFGYGQPAQVLATVRAWHHGRYRGMRSPRTRERLTDVQPMLIEALAQSADPDAALVNFDRFLMDLPSGLQLFSLLRTRPGLLQLVADIMGSAPRLARILSRRRRLFDALLDSDAFGSLPGPATYARLLQAATGGAATIEDVLDATRIVAGEQSFLIGMRTLAGALSGEQSSRAYSDLAGAVIAELTAVIERDLTAVHGRIPGCSAAVVALGKLGGFEMTASSDLDLIVIYDAPPEAMTGQIASDGGKPLEAPQYYARLTQRLVAALSAPTAEGTLYDCDLRLRPSGHKGPLATSLASFDDYQNNDAWTWEHMALTRARVVSGPAALRAKIERTIAGVLTRPREAAAVLADVNAMRDRVASEKPAAGPWDLKLVRGGQLDLEFIAQALQLVHAAERPGVLSTNTLDALTRLAAAGVLGAEDGERLREAARLFSNVTGLMRLLSDGPFNPATAPLGLKARLARAGAAPSFSALEAHLQETCLAVKSAYDRVIVAKI